MNIEAPILRELKRLQSKEGKSLGCLISDLLAQVLSSMRHEKPLASPRLDWISRPMRARIDLTDKEMVRAALKRDE